MNQHSPMVQALLQPKAYPDEVAQVELVETHISWIFLTGQYVYKVKKPVDYGFLDFTKLDKRRFFCQQEVELNRRLSPQVYLDVVEVRQENDSYTIQGPGQPVDYAVKMRQLPQERRMDVLLKRGELSVEDVHRLARKIAHFHKEAATSREITRLGGIQALRQNVQENFQQTRKYIGEALSQEVCEELRAYCRAFLRAKAPLFARRPGEGRIRDCHGDLHTTQVFFADDIYIIDCIEFNQRFRYSDVGLDIAFMAMDLDHHGHQELSRAFVEAYIEASGDMGVTELLDFFKCYRAYVRAKVTSFRLDDPGLSEAERPQVLAVAQSYYRLAYGYTQVLGKPALLVVAGLMGTGKSRLASEVARRWGLEYVASDAVRKTLASIAPTEHRYEPFGQGIYSPDFSQRTYEAMLREARERLMAGKSVVVDGTFRLAKERQQAVEVARETGAHVWIIECTAPEDEIHRRLDRRLRTPGSVSNGRWELFSQQRREWEPVTEVPPSHRITLDTSTHPAQTVQQLLYELYLRTLQEDARPKGGKD